MLYRTPSPTHHLVALLFITILCFFSCSKEKAETNFLPENAPHNAQEVSDREPISAQEARRWFTGNYGQKKSIANPATLQNAVLDVVPVWAFAQAATYWSSPVVICPIQPPPQAHPLFRFFLVFQRSADQITAQLVVCRAENGSATNGKPLTLGNFSGTMASLDLEGNYFGSIHLVKDGSKIGEADPLLDGNGAINAGNSGTLSSQQPWWQTSGGWNNVYVTGIHNITTNVHTSITPVLPPAVRRRAERGRKW